MIGCTRNFTILRVLAGAVTKSERQCAVVKIGMRIGVLVYLRVVEGAVVALAYTVREVDCLGLAEDADSEAKDGCEGRRLHGHR